MIRWFVATVCALLIVAAAFAGIPADKVVFLDVGQGDSILMQKGTRQVLIDGGSGMAVLQRLGEELPWFDRQIEVIVATHPDRDHLEGLLHVMERYEVELVLLPQMPHTSQLQRAWLDKLQDVMDQRRVQYRFAWAGQQVRVSDDLTVRILGPLSENGTIVAPGGKTNNAAVLVRADYAGLSFLLTADAEAVVERRLVQDVGDRLDVDVLKAGHHGSKTSTTPELLAAATPGAVVISVGGDNRYGHPNEGVLQRLGDVPLWRTDEDGSVRFVREGSRWLASSRSGFSGGAAFPLPGG
jgi:competence protein ComEC